jgi:molecular chaperone HscB
VNQIDIKQNYFDLFALPKQFRVDQKLLEQHYQKLQRQTHPDRFSGDDEHSRRIAMQAASYVNSAYSTLRDPLKRAVYLLEIDGVDFQSSSRALPADFLEEQIELRELLAHVSNDPEALQTLLEEMKAKTKLLYRKLADHLGVQCHEKSVIDVQELQFFHKIQKQTEEMLFELES